MTVAKRVDLKALLRVEGKVGLTDPLLGSHSVGSWDEKMVGKKAA